MLGCDRVFYYPDQRVRCSPADHELRFEDVYFETDDGVRLHGWFLPSRGGKAKGTVLHIHGNAANVTGHLDFVYWLPDAGYSVLTFDYRGYGRSGGRISREGSLKDAAAALDFLRARPEVDPERIVLFGQSIGGAISIAMAAERPGQLRAVALDSTFTGYREIVSHHIRHNPALLFLAWWFPWTIPLGHDPIDRVGQLAPTPILIMHGRRDRIAPWPMAQRLYDASGQPRELWLIDDMDHMQVWFEQPEESRRRLLDFYTRSLKS
ncbi:MAG TPA: alpha/beta hydrolase [Phycisphaerae bacterium]|nr:alpha/beta hydrolase [Phycisphaerae bacterium]